MTLPNFLIIGAAKSGTTALYRYLSDHSQIFMSPRKELHFFSYPETSKLVNGPDSYHRICVSSLDDYKSFFLKVNNEIAIGEASPSYLYFPKCANRIKSLLPETKIIAILRNPVERAYSSYMHAIRDGWEPITDFSLALDKEEQRIRDGWEIVWHYKRAGLYYSQLVKYYDLFSKSQIFISLYEDLKSNPHNLLKKIFNFLNVDDEFVPNISIHPNVSGTVRSQFVYKVLNHLFLEPNLIKSISQKLLPESTRWRFTTQIRNLNIKKNPFPEKLRNQLKIFFHNDILNLQDLIERDLNHWIN